MASCCCHTLCIGTMSEYCSQFLMTYKSLGVVYGCSSSLQTFRCIFMCITTLPLDKSWWWDYHSPSYILHVLPVWIATEKVPSRMRYPSIFCRQSIYVQSIHNTIPNWQAWWKESVWSIHGLWYSAIYFHISYPVALEHQIKKGNQTLIEHF